jgi:hypothetical protein
MEALGHHLMFRLIDDRVIVPSTPKRRLLARTVYRLATPAGLVGFGVADSHLHVALRASRGRSGKLAHDLCCALHFAVEPRQHFERTRIKPIENQKHLETVLGYAFRQKWHHGIQVDALRDGTSLPELLGLRVLTCSSVLLVRELLPRLRREDLLRYLGPPLLELAAGLDPERDPPAAVLDAAAGAFGLPDLEGRCERSRAARAALLQVPASAPLSTELQGRLALPRSSVWRARQQAVPASHDRAVRLQLGLRRWLREHGRRDEDSLG